MAFQHRQRKAKKNDRVWLVPRNTHPEREVRGYLSGERWRKGSGFSAMAASTTTNIEKEA